MQYKTNKGKALLFSVFMCVMMLGESLHTSPKINSVLSLLAS